MTDERLSRRATFNSIAGLYDQARPGYPPALLDDLTRHAGPFSRILEIGPGTGQLTVPLARLGVRIVAVELGPDLAAAARHNLRDFPDVEVINADFETWTPPAEPFDLVVIATAFHWLDERTRLERCARVLRPGGVLAVIETHHIGGGTTEFFAEVQTSCYERFDPTVEPGLVMPTAADIPGGLHYEWEQTYSTAAYLDLLRTYSSTLDLDPANAAALLDCIGSTIDRNYGGHITKRYLTRLLLSRP